MFIRKCLQYAITRLKFRGRISYPFGTMVSLNSFIEGGNKIEFGTSFNGELGYGSYIGKSCIINARIGKFSSIGHDCRVISGVHPYTYPYVSTSPAFYSTSKSLCLHFANRQVFNEHKYADEKLKIPVVIGNDCWLNANVTIISGVTIHDGAVILAGAVVTKDVPPYAIVGGVPAKIIKYRYDQETINWLLKIKWWNKNLEWLKQNWKLMNNIENLKGVLN